MKCAEKGKMPKTKWLADKDGHLYASMDDFIDSAERAAKLGIALQKFIEVLKTERTLAYNSYKKQNLPIADR